MDGLHRREFVRVVGATGFGVGLAGCITDLDGEGPSDSDNGSAHNNSSADNGNQTDGGTDDGTDDGEDEAIGEVLEDFEEDFDRWRDYDTYGEFGKETDEVYDGSQALRIVAEENEPYVGVVRAFSEPLDLTGKNLSLALNVNSPNIYRITVRLLAPGQGNMVHLNRTQTGPVNDWVRIDLGATSETGEPDIGEVYEMQIVGRRHSGEDPIDMTIDDVRVVDAPDQGMVVLSWDDGHGSQTTTFDLHQEFGFPGVAGVIPNSVGRDGRLDIPQLREMQEAGWDIVSHPAVQGDGSTPLSEFDENQQRQTIEDAHTWLRQRGFEEGANHFVAPGNYRDATTMALLREYHESSMSYGGAPIGAPISDPHMLGRIDGSNASLVADYIDLAAKYNQVVIPMWHVIGEADNAEITEDTYRNLLEYIDAADVNVVTQSQLVNSDY